MNILEARVSNIEHADGISIVSFESSATQLRMMSLGLNTPIKTGSEVLLGVKASSIALAKDFTGELSTSNQLVCRIVSVENGTLLCSVKLLFQKYTIESIITKSSSLKMNLKEGDEVIALIKSSELSIVKVKV